MTSIQHLKSGLTQAEFDKLLILDLSDEELHDIPKEVFRCSNLEHLILINNNITKIPKEISKLTKLRLLSLSDNDISYIPRHICKLVNLRNLELDGNLLIDMTNAIGKLTNLISLVLSHNRLSHLPDGLSNLTNLERLYLDNNRLVNVPKIGRLTKLTNLVLSHNKLLYLPDGLLNLANLQRLYLDNNRLVNIPETISKLKSMTHIYLDCNPIEALPDSMGELGLIRLALTQTRITTLPESIERIYGCVIIRDHIFDAVTTRLLFPRTDDNDFDKNVSIYDDYENVHGHQIQIDINSSITNIMKDDNDTYDCMEMLESSLSAETKGLIMLFCEDKSEHIILKISFGKLFGYVWRRITKHTNKNTMLNILDDEIKTANCTCFTGKISRLVNVLCGFYDDIQVNISDNEQISAIITAMKKTYTGNDIEGLKDEIRTELKTRHISDNVIEEWLEYIE